MSRSFKVVAEFTKLPAGKLAESLGLPSTERNTARLLIGSREWLALPELGVFPLHAKIDTGALSSSLHAEDIRISKDRRHVRFITSGQSGEKIECCANIARVARVRSSTGESRKRVFIETTAAAPGGLTWPILLSLANRREMTCPLLLGRRALEGHFFIAPQGSHLLGTRRQLERGIS